MISRNEDIVIRDADGYKLYMDFKWDEAYQNGKRPCVLWVHGGAWRDHNLTRKYIPQEIDMWAKAGYLVASCDYRLVDEGVWPACLLDVRYALDFLIDNAEELGIDPDKIFVWGESAGGHLVSYIATDGKARGVCAWYPVVEFSDAMRYSQSDEALNDVRAGWIYDLFGKRDLTEEDIKDISPYYHINKDMSPCLVMHGNVDTLVSIEQSRMFVKKMQEVGATVKYVEVDGQGHGFFKGQEYYDIILDWMNSLC